MSDSLDLSGSTLPAAHGSLAYGVPPSAPGTIYALAIGGGFTVTPNAGRKIVFGRNREEVHVCVGEDDRRVSRQHGLLTYRDSSWWVENTGRLPVRLPGTRLLFAGEDPVPLVEGYTPLFVRGSNRREHLLELYVTGADGQRPLPQPNDATHPPRTWRITKEERLALIVLGQRYLLHEDRPQPLAWREAAAQLSELRPDEVWGPKKVEHTVTAVRTRLSKGGVPGLTREEVGEPVGNALNDNLLKELLLSTTLVPPDLAELDQLD